MFNLYQGDCLDIMNNIPDKSVDMVLCDLPYGITDCKWDIVIPFEKLWKQYGRVIKENGCIALFGSEPFSSLLRTSNLKMFKYDWIWKKNFGSNFLLLKYQPFKEHETVSIFGNKIKYYPVMQQRSGGGISRYKYEYNPSNTGKRDALSGYVEKHKRNNGNNGLRFPSSVQRFNCERGKHPNQKPITLLEYLIKTYTLESETVLDNCMGSGSTGVACKNLNRKFIGIEKDEKYFEIAKDRIEKHIVNGVLF